MIVIRHSPLLISSDAEITMHLLQPICIIDRRLKVGEAVLQLQAVPEIVDTLFCGYASRHSLSAPNRVRT